MATVFEQDQQMTADLLANISEIRDEPRPGLINALIELRIDGQPAPRHRDPGHAQAAHRWRVRHHHRIGPRTHWNGWGNIPISVSD